jgi:hypothetical protein
VGFRTDVGGVTVVNIEGVIKGLVETRKGVGVSVDRNAIPVFNRIRAEVIEPSDMVGMAVGVDNGVQAGDGGAKGLGTKIG